MSAMDLSRAVPKDVLLKSLKKFTGKGGIQLFGDPEIKRATSGVEGFTSVVLRVKVSYKCHDDQETKRHTFVVKRAPFDDLQLGLVKSSRFFAREGIYFVEVVPVMKEVSRGRVEVPLPVCYCALYDGVDDCIAMEDLALSGYRTPGRAYMTSGLDMDHCVIAMKALGRLHALAIAAERKILSDSMGNWIDSLPVYARDALWFEPKPGEPRGFFADFVENAIETMLQISKEMEGLPSESEASGDLARVLGGLWPTICRLVKPDKSGRNIVAHGDCWMNNMMFRYSKGSSGNEVPVDVKFIDLQITRYCHPSIDLLYFMFTSTKREFRRINMDRLIDEYYASMVQNLDLLECGSAPLTLEEFKGDFYGVYMPYGVIIGTLFGPMLLLEDDFSPSDAEYLTPEKCEEYVKTGNSALVRKRFATDQIFKSEMEAIVGEFVKMAFPEGLDHVDHSPLL